MDMDRHALRNIVERFIMSSASERYSYDDGSFEIRYSQAPEVVVSEREMVKVDEKG